MDYPVNFSSQLRQLLKSLRKARRLTQAELAVRLGVVQSRIADIERDPGAVSVEQLLHVLAMLGAQVVVRDTGTNATTNPSPGAVRIELQASAVARTDAPAALSVQRGPKVTAPSKGRARPPEDEPRGQW